MNLGRSQLAEFVIATACAAVLAFLVLWLTSCTPQAQARKAAIEKAEDELCAIRGAQKAAQGK